MAVLQMLARVRAAPLLAGAWLLGLVGRAVFSLPTPVLRLLAGRPPAVAPGLHPEAWLLARLSRRSRDLDRNGLPVPVQRRMLELSARPMALRAPASLRTEDRAVPGPGGPVPVRLYVPEAAGTPGPLLVYYHGGGWVQGSIATHDRACGLLAQLSAVRVLSVDYRLAPEHPFPAAFDDAVAAYAWAVDHAAELGVDPARIAVGGDSAGGNLAAVVALAACDDEELAAPVFQLLIYPACDLVEKAASFKTFADGFYLTEHDVDWFVDQYVPDRAQRADPRVSPRYAATLAGLPPAHVVTAATDPVRDEAEAYGRALRAAGVPVSMQRHGQLHGFFNTSAIRSSREATATIAGVLRHALLAP